MANKKDPFADAYPPGEKPPEDMDSLMNDISAPKKVGKMPNFSKSNKGSYAAKKKAEEEGGAETPSAANKPPATKAIAKPEESKEPSVPIDADDAELAAIAK